jgi:hypothetical protein
VQRLPLESDQASELLLERGARAVQPARKHENVFRYPGLDRLWRGDRELP